MSATRPRPTLLHNILRTAGPPLAIGLCVLSVSVIAAGALAWLVIGDEFADTATTLLGRTDDAVAPTNAVRPTGGSGVSGILAPADS